MDQETILQTEQRASYVKRVNMLLLLTLIIYLGYSLVLGEIIGILDGKLPVLEDPMFQLVSGQIALIAPSVFFFIRNGLQPNAYVRIKGMHPVTVLLVILFAYVSYPVIALCNSISLYFTENKIDGTMELLYDRYPVAVCIVAIAVIPSIVEEFVFRGVLYRTYQTVSVWKAAFLSALFFGLFHLNLNQMSYAIVMGIVFVLLNEATGTILSSVLMHAIINGTSVVTGAQYYKKFGTLADGTEQVSLAMIRSLCIASVFFVLFMTLLLKAMVRIEKRKEEVIALQHQPKNGKRILSVFGYLVILICILLIVATELYKPE